MDDAPRLPFLYQTVTPINDKLHADLKLRPDPDYRFLGAATATPLTLAEFTVAAAWMPIVFTEGAAPMPVALIALEAGRSPFLTPGGQWLPGAYCPGYARRFPFLLVADEDDRLVLCMDETSPRLSRAEGEPLFTPEGRPAPAALRALEFAHEYERLAQATRSFAAALAERGLLVERQIQAPTPSGGVATIDSVRVVDERRLAELPDDLALAWLRAGWIAGIEAHRVSLQTVARLIAHEAVVT